MRCRLVWGLSQTFGQAPERSAIGADIGQRQPRMIFSNYRGIVTSEEAERYFNILPPAQAENVVPMAKAS